MEVYLSIFIAFSILYYFLPKEKSKYAYIFLVIALSIMAYNAVPNYTDDLYRYFMQLNNLRRGGWSVFKDMMKDDTIGWGTFPVCGYYFYFISRLPSNNYLQAITIFLAYGSMFLIVWKVSIRFNISKWYTSLMAFFILSTFWFYDICSGVRNGLAFCIFGLCAYYFFVEKKHKFLCIIGFILMSGLHSSVIMLDVILLLTIITGKSDSKLLTPFMFLGMAVGSSFIGYISEFSNNDYILLIAGKAERHMGEVIDITQIGASYASNIATFVILLLLLIYFIPIIKKSKYKDDLFKYMKFINFTMAFAFGSMFTSGLVFLRLVRFLMPSMVFILIIIGLQIYSDNKDKKVKKQHSKSIIVNVNKEKNNIMVINCLIFFYTVIYMVYACTLSSLIWLHFS